MVCILELTNTMAGGKFQSSATDTQSPNPSGIFSKCISSLKMLANLSENKACDVRIVRNSPVRRL